jgi:ATP-dependent DNA helicase RecG
MQDEPDTMQDVSGVETQPERIRRILSFCESPRNREEIQKHVGLNNRDHFRKEILLPLLQKGLLLATLPDKPNSPKQQYRTAPAFVSREP